MMKNLIKNYCSKMYRNVQTWVRNKEGKIPIAVGDMFVDVNH